MSIGKKIGITSLIAGILLSAGEITNRYLHNYHFLTSTVEVHATTPRYFGHQEFHIDKIDFTSKVVNYYNLFSKQIDIDSTGDGNVDVIYTKFGDTLIRNKDFNAHPSLFGDADARIRVGLRKYIIDKK